MPPEALDSWMKPVKKVLLLLVVLALALAGVAYYTQHRNGRGQEDDYKTAHIEYGEMRDVIGGMAYIRPLEGIPVQSKIAGHVVELSAKINDTVEEGQPLIKLDPSDAQNTVAQANAALASARAAVKLANAQLEAAENGQKAVKRVRDKVNDKESNYGPVDKLKADAQLAEADGLVAKAKAAAP